jgi:hypothetical protein
MKSQLIAIVAAVLLVGCVTSQQSTPAPEAKPVEPVAEASQPEPPTVKAPDISLWWAAQKGDIEAVKQHIAAGTDVNPKDSKETPLHKAAYWGRKEIAELLIAKGADVNAKEQDGYTPLHWAARNGHKEIAELLIAKGADVNAKADGGRTPLDMAKLHPETADLLRKHGGKRGDFADLLRKFHGGKTSEELK